MSAFVDVFLRAATRADWLALAEARGILLRVSDERGERLVSAPGFAVDEIGPVVLVPGDSPTLDTRHHVNLRVSGTVPDFVREWQAEGTEAASNAAERALEKSGVQLLEAVKSPYRVWLGSEHLGFDPAAEPVEWAPDQKVSSGEKRTYQGTIYECRQAHTTQADWPPDLTLALWLVVPEGNVWQAGISVSVGDEYWYPDTGGTLYRCRQSHTTQTGWEPPNVLALWEPV